MSDSATIKSAIHDFDFLWGTWRIENARLRSRLTGSDVWEAFIATGVCRPVLDGSGNVDDFRPTGDSPWSGYDGGALRLCDPETGRWSISWFDNVGHRLLPPVHGFFVDGTGEFFGDDVHEGQPVLVWYRWHGITPQEAHWEQAFSPDGGASWETNWRMHFTRTAGLPER